MARAAEILKPQNVLIENVVGAVHDKNGVVQETATYLSKLGYNVSVGLIDLSRIWRPTKAKKAYSSRFEKSTY